MERYEIVRRELARVVDELFAEKLPEQRRQELRGERERLESEFAELARKGQLPPSMPYTT